MPNKMSGGQRKRRFIKTLERRRDYLAEFVGETTRGRSRPERRQQIAFSTGGG